MSRRTVPFISLLDKQPFRMDTRPFLSEATEPQPVRDMFLPREWTVPSVDAPPPNPVAPLGFDADEPVGEAAPAVDVEALRAELFEEVKAEAMAQARAEAEQRARAELQPIASRYVEAMAQAHALRAAAGRPNSEEVVDLALVIAAEILGQSLRINRTKLVSSVETALAAADGPATVRVAAEDLALAQGGLPEGTQLVPDEQLAPGEWVLETPTQLADGRVAARLAAVRGALVEALGAPTPDEVAQEPGAVHETEGDR